MTIVDSFNLGNLTAFSLKCRNAKPRGEVLPTPRVMGGANPRGSEYLTTRLEETSTR